MHKVHKLWQKVTIPQASNYYASFFPFLGHLLYPEHVTSPEAGTFADGLCPLEASSLQYDAELKSNDAQM